MLVSNGYLNANQLADLFEVDSSTIRRDLMYLEKGRKIVRTHGGVLPVLSSEGQDTPYSIRRGETMSRRCQLALLRLH
jgi:DeoR/GlpR family transcriptional regulator of sugar metabolism